MCIPGVEISLVVKQHLSTLVVAIEGSQVKRCVDIFVFVENALSLVPQQDLENTASSNLQQRVDLLLYIPLTQSFSTESPGEAYCLSG